MFPSGAVLSGRSQRRPISQDSFSWLCAFPSELVESDVGRVAVPRPAPPFPFLCSVVHTTTSSSVMREDDRGTSHTATKRIRKPAYPRPCFFHARAATYFESG